MTYTLSINRRDGLIHVSSDDKEWVEQKLDQYQGIIDQPPTRRGVRQEGGSSGHPGSDEGVPLPKYLRDLGPKSNKEKVTAIVLWAEANEGRDGLTSADIRKLWRRTNLKFPANLSRDLSAAVAEGWLQEEGGQFTATGFGAQSIGAD